MSFNKIRTTIGLSLAVLVLLSAPAASASDPTIEELLLLVDDLMRGDSSRGRMTMNVKTARFERSLSVSMVSKGTDRFLLRILSPKKEAGTATLKVGPEIWNYLPKVDRTIKLPASMMGGSWMGSHFSNDDVVQDSRYSEDFDCEFIERPADGKENWLINCVPDEDAVLVWGAVRLSIGPDLTPEEVQFFGEDGELGRTMIFSNYGDLGGRFLPRTMRMVPADKPDEYTEMVYEELELDVEVSDRLFTLQELRR